MRLRTRYPVVLVVVLVTLLAFSLQPADAVAGSASARGLTDILTPTRTPTPNPTPPATHPLEDQARQFLRQTTVRGVQVNPDELRLIDHTTSLTGTQLRFQQEAGGLRVVGSVLTVRFDASGQPVGASGRYTAGADAVSQAAGVDEQQAYELAYQTVGVQGDLREPARCELVIFPTLTTPVLAWEVSLAAFQPLGDWLVYVDAGSGQILQTSNRLRQAIDGPGAPGAASPAQAEASTCQRAVTPPQPGPTSPEVSSS